MWWLDSKKYLVETLVLDRDALHIYAALAIQIVSAWILRVPLTSMWPLAPVLLIEFGNEYVDLHWEVWSADARTLQWFASLHDVLNTLAVPVLLLVVLRLHDRRILLSAPPLVEPPDGRGVADHSLDI